MVLSSREAEALHIQQTLHAEQDSTGLPAQQRQAMIALGYWVLAAEEASGHRHQGKRNGPQRSPGSFCSSCPAAVEEAGGDAVWGPICTARRALLPLRQLRSAYEY